MHRAPCRAQRGVFMIEALVGILIFSVGILALIALQASAISAQTDAQVRIEASKRAEQLASEIWVNVDRTNAATVQTSLANFVHQPTGASTSCNFSGAAAASAIVTGWATQLTTAPTALPGTAASMLQVTTNTTAAGFNQVAITVCWKAAADAAPSRHTLVTYVN